MKLGKQANREAAMMVVSVLLALLALGSSFVSSPVGAISIPAQYDGFAFPPKETPTKLPLVLEAFIDPTCPDCRSAWPTIKSLIKLYGLALSIIIHPFPVPFHHNSFFSARALHIANSLNTSATVPLLELIYKNQESLLNDATADKTPSNVVQLFISLGVEAGLSPHGVWKGFSDTSTNQVTQTSFKYGCSRYVTSTPFYLVNGVVSKANETWSVGKWRSVLEPLIRGQPTLTVASFEDDGALKNYLPQ